jgi:hypothetical protein
MAGRYTRLGTNELRVLWQPGAMVQLQHSVFQRTAFPGGYLLTRDRDHKTRSVRAEQSLVGVDSLTQFVFHLKMWDQYGRRQMWWWMSFVRRSISTPQYVCSIYVGRFTAGILIDPTRRDEGKTMSLSGQNSLIARRKQWGRRKVYFLA